MTEFVRDHNLYSCGFIKHRQLIEICSYEKNIGKVAAKFKQLKYKYKSAWFKTYAPPRKIMKEIFNSPNPILERFKENI